MAVLFFSSRVWGNPGTSLSGKLSFDANSPSAEIVLGSGGAINAESGMFMSLDGFRIGGAHFSADLGDGEMFLGSGTIEGGFALRTKPYTERTTIPIKPWTAKRGQASGSQIFGTTWGGLAFFMLCEPGSAMERVSEVTLPVILQESFRFGGLEYTERFGEFSAGIAASLTDRPREAPGDGWRAGESFEHGSTHFVLSSAASREKGGILAGTWASVCGGYLESPGWAASLDFEAGIAPENARAALSINAFFFGSNPAYKSHEGESALYDFLADAQASIRIKPWKLAARCAIASLTDPRSGAGRRPRLKAAVPVFELYPWLWRTDLLKSSLDLVLDVFTLGARLAADEYGLENGSISLRCADLAWKVAKGAASPTIGAAISARFARSDDSIGDAFGGTGDTEGQGVIMDSGIPSMPGQASGLYPERLHLGSIDFECGIGWKGSANSGVRNGKAQILISSKMGAEESVLIMKGSIAQKFRLCASGELSILMKCPKDGYSLDVSPHELPLLELEFSFGRK